MNEETGIEEIEDICEGEEIMEEKSDEKYLGDVISTDGKNIKNVKARVAKGKGIANRIISIIDGIPFGDFYFEVAMILRNSLLVSSMLSNSEALQIFDDPTKKQKTEGLGLTGSGRHQRFEIKC